MIKDHGGNIEQEKETNALRRGRGKQETGKGKGKTEKGGKRGKEKEEKEVTKHKKKRTTQERSIVKVE